MINQSDPGLQCHVSCARCWLVRNCCPLSCRSALRI
jgi:hypothetical protein